MNYAIGYDNGKEIEWMKSTKGEIIIFESRQQAKDQLKRMGLKRKKFLIVPTDSEELATFFVNYLYESQNKRS